MAGEKPAKNVSGQPYTHQTPNKKDLFKKRAFLL